MKMRARVDIGLVLSFMRRVTTSLVDEDRREERFALAVVFVLDYVDNALT